MAKLYIMSGLPFSGKTTLAKKISEKLGAVYLSFDELWVSREAELPQDKVEGWQTVRDIAKREITKKLGSDISVVYDDLNGGEDHRTELRELAQGLGAEAFVIFANTPKEVRLQRMQENLETKQRHDVEIENLRKAEADFQEPQFSENTVNYEPYEDLDNWLGKLS